MQFTIFTPTFNRCHTLDRVYNSLASQTFKDFEWLIVDDGSTDGTFELIKKWKETAPFPIQYYYQENSGMLPSLKKAVKLANGLLFLKADSDDSFKPDTLEIFDDRWHSIHPEERYKFAGVTCLVENESGQVIGDIFPEDNFDSTRAEILYRYKVKGEKWGFHRLDVLAEYADIENVGRYFAMGLIINAIGKKYKTRFINTALRTYYQGTSDQISNMSPQRGAQRWFTYAFAINDDIEYLTIAPFLFFKIAMFGSRLGLHASIGLSQQIEYLISRRAKFLWGFALIFGFFAFFKRQN